MHVSIKNLIDDEQRYLAVRQIRCSEGVSCSQKQEFDARDLGCGFLALDKKIIFIDICLLLINLILNKLTIR